jgi:acetolactate synthase small subunit
MVRVELTTEEAKELHEILDNYLSDLRMEIVDTESHDFRAMLKKRKDFIERLLQQLKPEAA